MANIVRFRDFVQAFTRFHEQVRGDEIRVFDDGREMLARLIATDDWLPDAFAQPDPAHYRQYLLHCDALERFCVVCFVWGPGQQTPVHDHTVWGMVGVMRGAESCEAFTRDPRSGGIASAGTHRVMPGEVDLVSPRVGDIHRVSNALADRASVSIHVYGGNIGRIARHAYEVPGGRGETFVSGYSNDVTPNLWG